MRFPSWPRRRRESELEEEIQGHLEMAIRDHVERGETADGANAVARREFGNVGLVKEATRAMWGWVWLEQLGRFQCSQCNSFASTAVRSCGQIGLGMGQ